MAVKKNAPQGPEGPVGNPGPAGIDTGSAIIKGTVFQYNEHYGAYIDGTITQYTSALNNVTVSIDGRDFSTVTDSFGKYILSHLPQGVYDLSFKKPGAALSKKQQIICPNVGTRYLNASVFDIPTAVFKDGYVKDTGNVIKVKLYFDPQPQPVLCTIVYGKTNKIDLEDPDTYDGYLYKAFGGYPQETNSQYFLHSNDLKYIYPGGTVFYIRVYPIATTEFGYFDYIKNKGVFTAYGTPLAGTFSVTMGY